MCCHHNSYLCGVCIQVVVLIDNYDTPMNEAVSDAARSELQKLYIDFFTIIKSMDAYIRLTYVTGVNKVALCDMYGGASHLIDLTNDPEYTTLCGATDSELRALAAHYSPGVDYTSAQLDDLKKKYYGGSSWDPYNSNDYSLTDPSSLIKVPVDRPFIKPLESCVNYPSAGAPEECPHPVGLDAFIDEAVAIILRELPRDDPDSCTYQKMPIILSRLSRGGKTTGLKIIFDRLHGAQLGDSRIRVMIVSFNSSSGFLRRDGETQKQAILRVIAQQLVEGTDSELDRLEVDEAELDRYIGNKPFLLLIDEINALSASHPLDPDTSSMLRDLFLRENRHLVMTTHVPLDLDLLNQMSMRGHYSVPLPTSTDVDELRAMSNICSALTPLEVARYGGIPSLIYVVKAHSTNLKEVYDWARIKGSIYLLNEDESAELYEMIIDEFVKGAYPSMGFEAKTDRVEGILRRLYQFASSTATGELVWPLVYMEYIIDDMIVIEPALREAKHSLLAALRRTSNTAITGNSESNTGWELILQIGILLQCTHAYLNPDEGLHPLSLAPFSLVPPCVHAEVRHLTIPARIETLDDAWNHIALALKEYRNPTVILAVPDLVSFPTYDMFLIYTPGAASTTSKPGSERSVDRQALSVEGVRVAGIQANASRGLNHPPPAFVNSGSYIVHGGPVDEAHCSTPPGWVYMSNVEVQKLLGYSLANLASIDWTQ